MQLGSGSVILKVQRGSRSCPECLGLSDLRSTQDVPMSGFARYRTWKGSNTCSCKNDSSVWREHKATEPRFNPAFSPLRDASDEPCLATAVSPSASYTIDTHACEQLIARRSVYCFALRRIPMGQSVWGLSHTVTTSSSRRVVHKRARRPDRGSNQKHTKTNRSLF